MAFLKRGPAAFQKRPGGAPGEELRARGDPSEPYHMKSPIIWGNREKPLKFDEIQANPVKFVKTRKWRGGAGPGCAERALAHEKSDYMGKSRTPLKNR